MATNTKSDGLKKLYEYVNSLIESMEVIPTANKFPSFAEMKSSPTRFYELFSEATYRYNVICDALQKLQHANAMIVRVLNELTSPECKESFNVKTLYSKSFMNAKTECSSLINCYETAKSSSESIVKFFNSAQYIICSNKFDATSANY